MATKIRLFLASMLFLALPDPSPAEETFSWRQCAGQSIRVMLNKHSYVDGIKRKLQEFEQATGIRVAYVQYPEEQYSQRLERAFADSSGQPDVYMTGVYRVWEYAGRGRIAPLDPFLANPSLTRQSYNPGDFFPSVCGAFRWNGKAGAPLGSGPLWAIPIGFEASALTYHREMLAQSGLPVPGTLEELVAAGGKLKGLGGEGAYGVAVRGMGLLGLLHGGYITAFTNYGARDMAVENGRLVSLVNSPEAVAVTDLWVSLLRSSGPPDWEYYDWHHCLIDMGVRKTAFLYDSDALGYFINSPGKSGQAGKLGIAPPPVPAGGDRGRAKANLWVWGLAINPESRHSDAAWLFVQYFTSQEFQTYAAVEWKAINPPRRSVFANPVFQRIIGDMPGYGETLAAVLENGGVFFTPTPYFFEIAERWAAVIYGIAHHMYPSTQAGMDSLKVWMDGRLEKVAVE